VSGINNILDYIKTGKTQKARKMIEEVLVGNPEEYFYCLALCCCMEKSYGSSIYYFKCSIASGLKHYLVYYNMGIAYMELGEKIKAEECFKLSISLNKNFPKNYISLSRIYLISGNKQKSYRIIKTALCAVDDPELSEIEKKLICML
jgi:tetratricopeptide (TPR) repeat protein